MTLQPSAVLRNFYFARTHLTQTDPYHTLKKSPVDQPNPKKLPNKAGHAVEQEYLWGQQTQPLGAHWMTTE